MQTKKYKICRQEFSENHIRGIPPKNTGVYKNTPPPIDCQNFLEGILNKSAKDRMDFFKKADTIYNTDYKIRNALIDYFNKVDTISPKIDNRFIKIN